MTLTQLRYFCSAARFHSITQAAKAHFVTQPTVSIAIRDLEKEFSISLFSYTKNRLELTTEGEEFFRRAVSLLQYSDEMQAQFSDPSRYRPTVRLGIPPMLGTVFFPELMDAFHEKYPEIYLELSEYSSVRASSMVQDEQLDLGLVNMEMYSVDKFSNLILSEETLDFCVCGNHELAGRDSISIRDLDAQPLILFNQDSVQNQLLTQQFYASDIHPRIVMHCSQVATTLKFLRQGKCGAFLFRSMLPVLPEVRGIPLDPPIPMKVGLIWKKGKYISASTQKFIRFCERWTP